MRAPNAGPVAEDDVTEWFGTPGRSPAATEGEPPGAEPRAEEAGPDQPESASWLGAAIAALIVIPALVIGSLAVVAVRHSPERGRAAPASAREEAVRGGAAAWIARG